MKRHISLTFILTLVFLLIDGNLFCQSRVNATLPVVIDTGVDISNFTGWELDNAGQWQSAKNRIPNHYGSISQLNKMKLYNVSHNGKDFIIFDLVIPDLIYEYPSIKMNAYRVYVHKIYIIEKQNL